MAVWDVLIALELYCSVSKATTILGVELKTFSPNCSERFEKTSESGTEISINLGIALQMIVTGVLESLSISSEWQMSGC